MDEAIDAVLDLEDDAAYVSWGGSWRMPILDEFQTLIDKTTREWIWDYNGTGVSGCLFTSNVVGEEGHPIFLPGSGRVLGTEAPEYSSARKLEHSSGGYMSSTNQFGLAGTGLDFAYY